MCPCSYDDSNRCADGQTIVSGWVEGSDISNVEDGLGIPGVWAHGFRGFYAQGVQHQFTVNPCSLAPTCLYLGRLEGFWLNSTPSLGHPRSD